MNNKTTYFLGIKYIQGQPNTYKGVFIDDELKQIILVNTGDVKEDKRIALEKLYGIVGKVTVYYLSSYDDYFMDVEYKNDPEFRKNVDYDIKNFEY